MVNSVTIMNFKIDRETKLTIDHSTFLFFVNDIFPPDLFKCI